MKQQYDICVVSFSDIRFDGRTKNLIEALINLEKKVIAFSITPINPFNEKIKHITIKTNYNHRVLFRWFAFNHSVKNYLKDIEYKTYWAADLYSLVCGNRYLIYDSREVYSELSVLHKKPIKQKIISYIEKKNIKNVNVLITSGTRDTKYIKDKYQLDIPCYEIYNYPKHKEYIKSNTIREQLNISNDKIILLYQGVLLEGRGLLPIMNAIKNHNEYVLVILGDGKYRDILSNYVAELGINNMVYFAGNIDYNDLHLWTCSADIGLCNIEPISYSYELALPNKLFEYILAELPVLITDLPALVEIVNNNKLGETISRDNNKDEIIAALNKLLTNKERYKNNIRAIKQNYVYEMQYDSIKDIIFI